MDQHALTKEALEKKLAMWSLRSDRIVFTNGCFDLLHSGHIQVLTEAAKEGDRLIVGLNSDASIKRLKGEHKPYQSVEERACLLSHLKMVDAVIVFEEDTPLQLIEWIQPDILIKGGDYEVEAIIGYDIVTKKGGQVKTIPLKEGKSSTDLVQQIIKQHKN